MLDEQLQSRLGIDLTELIDDVGAPLVRADQVTAWGPNRDKRGSWRLEFADGRLMKGRRFESPMRAAQVEEIRRSLPPGMFVRVLARAGSAMLEEWVEGMVLDAERVTLGQVRESGRMLGRLHACPAPAGIGPSTIPGDVRGWMDRIRRHLLELVEAEALTSDLASAIETRAASHLPDTLHNAVVHRDLCPANIVMEADGALRWIDAGTLMVGPVEEDLCRAWHRWPMSAVQIEAFVEGYAAHGDAGMLRSPSDFWRIAVLTGVARFGLVEGGLDLKPLLDRLEQVVRRPESAEFIDDIRTGGSVIGDLDQGHGCDLAFRGLRIVVRSNVAGPVSWLDEFVTPQLHDDAVPTAQCRIGIVVDSDRCAALRATPSGPPDERRMIDCFTLDSHFEQHTLWRDGSDRRVLHDEAAGVFISIDAEGSGADHDRCIEIIAEQDSRRLRLDLMRVVRELATLHAQRQGDLHVHGAAVVRGGRAVIVAGPKRAGKTMMLLNALSRPDTEYLSNDRLLLQPTTAGVQVRGMPTIIKVRSDGLELLPTLPPMGWQRPCLTIEECARGGPLSDAGAGRPGSMSPIQFRNWLGVSVTSGAELAALVFPRLEPRLERFDIQLLDEIEAAQRLAECLFPSGTTGRPPEAFESVGGGMVSDHRVTLDACAAIAASHPCLDCRIGPQAYAVPNVWDAIVTSARMR